MLTSAPHGDEVPHSWPRICDTVSKVLHCLGFGHVDRLAELLVMVQVACGVLVVRTGQSNARMTMWTVRTLVGTTAKYVYLMSLTAGTRIHA